MTLFPDSETYQKERPKTITEDQKAAFFLKAAKEIVKQGYSSNDPEDIASDLSKLSMTDTGYEMAKELEDSGMDASYNIGSQFIEYLEIFSMDYFDVITGNVKDWVRAHNILPKYKFGDKLEIPKNVILGIKGGIVYVTGIKKETAEYLIYEDPNHKGGFVLAFEKIELNCKKIN